MKSGIKQDSAVTDEGFLQRWSRNKLQDNDVEGQKKPDLSAENEALSSIEHLTDKDMPPIESLTGESDFSAFLSPNVSDELRRLALRKLFSSPEFNIRDGLDDYDEEFNFFEKLGDIVTADMKHQLEVEAKKKMAQQTKDSQDQQAEHDEPVNTEVTELDHDEDKSAMEEITPGQMNQDDVEVS